MAEILLYGVIGDAFDKLDAATVTAAIRANTGPLSIRINSPGGYVMEGLAIVAAMRAYPGPITVHIDGLAASMASVIAMAGGEIVMAEAALMMVHKPWDSTIGNADDLRRDAAQLDRIEQQLIGIYAKQTGLPEGELAGMLAAETWLTPEEALSKGFVTSIAASLKIAAMAKATGFGFRHLPDRLKESNEMPDTAQAVALERTRISTIMAISNKHHVPQTVSQDLISRGVPLDQARDAILDYLAAEGDRLNIGHQSSRYGGFGDHTTLDNPATRGKAMGDAIAAKLTGKVAEGPAAEYRGMALVDIARECLNADGVRDVFRLSADRVAALAFQQRSPFAPSGARGYVTTSDFPTIMQAGIDAALVSRYKTQESQLKQLTSARDLPDFKTHQGIQVSGFGSLDQVNEHGEFKNKNLSERGQGLKLNTFGNIIGFTRQMLINDSLGALGDIISVMGRAAAELEAQLLAAAINSNIVLDDGVPWFNAGHANLAAVGGAPTLTTLDAGRLAMRSQKDLDGVTLIDAQPKFLLVPAGLQTAAEVLLGSVYNPEIANNRDVPNPFYGKLTPVSDPRLTSATAWFLFADPNFSPGFVSLYLNGQREPFTDQQDGWRIDGVEFKVRHDFGAGVLDPKMAYKNPGAGV